MASSYTVSTQGAKLSTKGCNGMVVQFLVSATRATSTLACSNPAPSSHGSEMVKADRRGLILTKPKGGAIDGGIAPNAPA